MKEIVKKIILKLYPELDAGLLTPKFAVVTSIPDAPEEDCISDQYREYIAVNVRLLDHHMRIDENIEEVKTVPVGGQVSGHYRGTLQIPAPGNIVEIAYAYGKMTMPFIRTVLPSHMTLWPAESDATVIQHNINSFQSCDRAGNWTRETDADIIDSSNNNITEAINKLEYLTNEIKTIQGYSFEKTTGIKRIIAGAIKFLTTASAHIGAAFNLNLTSGQDTNINTAQNRTDNTNGFRNITTIGAITDTGMSTRTISTTGAVTDTALLTRTNITTGILTDTAKKARTNLTEDNFTDTVIKNRMINTTGMSTTTTDGLHRIIGQQVWVGSKSENTFNIIIEYMTTVISALNIIASHTHSKIGAKPGEEGKIKQQAADATQKKTRLETISIK